MPAFREQLRQRYAVLGVAVVVVLGVLLIRLWSLQVLHGDEFATAAENNRVREVSVDAPRGRILDRDRVPLVVNRSALAVTISPAARNDEELLSRLSVVLGVTLDSVLERAMSVRDDPLKPRIVAVDVPMTAVSYLSEHEAEFPGIEVEAIPVRDYPHGTLAAHVLGYTGEITDEQLKESEIGRYALGDIVGRTGVERQYESVLQGVKGFTRLEVDAFGSPRKVIEEAEPVAGRDVVLTIDADVQAVAEQALVDALAAARADEFPNARAGAAVVLDVKTGEIVAMASVPTYDPAAFIGGIAAAEWERLNAKESEYPLNNRAIHAAYPPASTFKVVTAAAGLEHQVTSTGHSYYCSGRWTGFGEQWGKNCWELRGHGQVDFFSGMAYSCDIVYYDIGYQLESRGAEELQAWSRNFGLGATLGVDLPGEVSGRVPDAAWKAEFNRDYPEYRRWLPGDTINLSIGQGDMLTTPLQMAAVFAGLGNNGTIMRPHVLKEVIDAKGETVRAFEPEVVREIGLSEANLRAIHDSLVGVTEYGTGLSAFRGFGTPIAGKTGTAEVAGRDNYAWFTAYAPASEPRYSVAIVLEQGGGGGANAAPAARSILAQLLGLPTDRVTATDVSR
ncbi:MAG: penicillin-binding protein 2 [Clostridiales bacterium]|nr:penicillin-binding protein 2 [Clostridiales bacterium]